MGLGRRAEMDAWLLIASSFLANVPAGFLLVALPIYLDRIGLHPELIGVLFTVSGLASAALMILFGVLADRYGRKQFVLLGTALPVVTYLLLALSTSRPLILLASAVGGIGLAGGMSGALVTSGFNALLSEKTDADRRTWMFTAAEMAWVAAILIGSLAARIPSQLQAATGLTYRSAYHEVFLGMVVLGLLSTVIVLPITESHSVELRRASWLPHASGKRILQLSLVLGLLGLGIGMIIQLLPLWFDLRFHVGESFLGPWYAAGQVADLVTLLVAAPLARRWGPVRLVVITQALGSLVLVGMGFAPGVGAAIALWIARGAFVSAAWPVQQAYVMDVVDPADRATGASAVNAAWSVSSALTPPAGGYFLAAGLYTWPFLIGGVFYAASLCLFYGLFRRIRATETAQKIA